MSKLKALMGRLLKALLLLAVFGSCTIIAALLALFLVSRQLASSLEPGTPPSGPENRPAPETVEIDFYQASGIGQPELAAFLKEKAEQEEVDDFPAFITLRNHQGEFLADARVIVRWNGAEQRILVGKSGVIRFLLDPSKLPGLTILAPKGFVELEQSSIPLGTAYAPEEKPDTSAFDFNVVWDGSIRSDMTRQLLALRASGKVLPAAILEEQLRRTSFPFRLREPPTETLTPAEIYQRHKDSVVIVGHLFADGHTLHAGGFVLDASGLIATAYHVVDKPTAVARAVMTSDGRVFPIDEVLAADRSADVAVLKIDASDLQAASLSHGDREGSPITVISHPAQQHFSLTQGHISRYGAVTLFGRVTLRMNVTAAFADGSSGAPIFNAQGAVSGIVSSTDDLGNGMTCRSAAPATSIRRLIGEPTP